MLFNIAQRAVPAPMGGARPSLQWNAQMERYVFLSAQQDISLLTSIGLGSAV